MKMNMKEQIDGRLSALRYEETPTQKAKKVKFIKPPMAIAAACLCLLLAVPVLGATVPGVNHAIAQVSPGMAQMLAPIRLTYEDQEVEITVRAAMSDGYVSVVYMDMTNYMVEISEGNYCNAYYISDWWIPFNEYHGMSGIDNSEKVRLIGSDEDLRNKKVTLRFQPVNNQAKNQWQLTFKIQPVSETFTDCEISHGKMDFTKVSVSPIGVTFIGGGKVDCPPPEVTVTLRDGSTVTCDLVLFKLTNEKAPWEYRISYVPLDGPLDVSQIKEVQFGENTISFAE